MGEGCVAPLARDRTAEVAEQLACLRTKSTPVQLVQFTYRNVLLAAGAYSPT